MAGIQLIKLILEAADKTAGTIRAVDSSGASWTVPLRPTTVPDHSHAVLRDLVTLGTLPIEANALGATTDGDVLEAPQWVLDPDYLVDVSTISESFKPEGALVEMQIINRFKPRETSKHIILGNLVNFFLDEMVRRPKVTFEELLSKVFQQQPLGIALMTDQLVREMVEQLKVHFSRIRYVLTSVFPSLDIPVAESLLEPSFISARYGLQGRLDLLSHRGEKPVIVELKSGKPFMANSHGLSQTHYVQTLLYDLLIRSVHDNEVEPENYILYSSVPKDNLRVAPRSKNVQARAIDARNRFILLDRQLMRGGQLDPLWLEKMVDPSHPGLQGFTGKDHQKFLTGYRGLDPVEKAYFLHFAGFLAREQHLSKTGTITQGQHRGFAALWRAELNEKVEQFEILAYLEWEGIDQSDDQPVLVFRRTEAGNTLSNFREGDIGILYGHDEKGGPLDQQLYRGSIIRIDHQTVHFRLRSKQIREKDLTQRTHWHIEKDFLDSGFMHNYAQLGEWMQAPAPYRQLLMGRRPPDKAEPNGIDYTPVGLNDKQASIFRKIIQSREYFLLWGPPGTGKTSVMLRELSRYWLDATEDRFLLLAYTNRAVDEICEALESIGYTDYVRIGSRYSTGIPFRSRLLEGQIKDVSRRDELVGFLQSKRVYVSTLSSILGKTELFSLVRFASVVIDEASQIVEPMLAGLLSRFDRFILIGDHRQLPAVVQQPDELCAVDDPQLTALGMHRLSDSLFERLYLRSIASGWDWAYDQLCHQGRMHEALAAFPNRFFYGGSLQLMEGVPDVLARQRAELGVFSREKSPAPFLSRRLIHLDVPTDGTDPLGKINAAEAQAIARLVRIILGRYGTLEGQEIGVITPYRSQIAQIVHEMRLASLPVDRITVDTVERYQGGARDVIILSLCLNRAAQLEQLVSKSAEGVDRKLNVALTRAKEQLIVLGNSALMRGEETYAQLADYAAEHGFSGDVEDLVGLDTE